MSSGEITSIAWNLEEAFSKAAKLIEREGVWRNPESPSDDYADSGITNDAERTDERSTSR